VKSRFFTADGENPNARRKMEVQGPDQGCGRMKGRDFTGGNLAQGVHTAVGSAGARDGHGLVEDFLEGFLEGELDGGIGILALPAVKVLPPVGEKETVRDRPHARINGGRLRAKDDRSSR